jgi:hypothetical protein
MSFSTVHAMIRDIEFFNSSRSVMGYDFTILYAGRTGSRPAIKSTPH